MSRNYQQTQEFVAEGERHADRAIAAPHPQAPSATSDDVRDKPITEADYSRILADRSAWRARAEKAEARVAELEACPPN